MSARLAPRPVPRTSPRAKLVRARSLHVQAISLIDEALSELDDHDTSEEPARVAETPRRKVSELTRRRATEKLRRLGVTV